jgi:hypothetical protein
MRWAGLRIRRGRRRGWESARRLSSPWPSSRRHWFESSSRKERDRDGGEGGGVFAGELSRGGVHGVSKVGLDRLCWWFCLESWKESGVICKTKLNSHYPTQKGVGFHRTLEPTESFPKFYSFPHL